MSFFLVHDPIQNSALHLMSYLLNLFQYVTIPQSLSFSTLKLLKSPDHLFGKKYNLCLSIALSWLRLCVFGNILQKVMCPSQYITLGVHDINIMYKKVVYFSILSLSCNCVMILKCNPTSHISLVKKN